MIIELQENEVIYKIAEESESYAKTVIPKLLEFMVEFMPHKNEIYVFDDGNGSPLAMTIKNGKVTLTRGIHFNNENYETSVDSFLYCKTLLIFVHRIQTHH